MNTTTALITFALIAWVLQITMSWLQIRRFNNAFAAMQRGCYLGIGRTQAGRFKPKVLVALSLDENKNVIDSILMRGITVFALPKPILSLHGVNLTDINVEKVFPNQKACQSALISAMTVK